MGRGMQGTRGRSGIVGRYAEAGAMLERAKRAAVRLLSPAQSYRFKCVPLVVQDRQLIAAIEDPHDFASLEAIAQRALSAHGALRTS